MLCLLGGGVAGRLRWASDVVGRARGGGGLDGTFLGALCRCGEGGALGLRLAGELLRGEEF